MTKKRVTIKIDTEEEEEFWRPRVTQKKSHFDLLQKVKIDDEIYDPVNNFPVVRKSVGSTELVDLEYLRLKDAEISSSASNDDESLSEFPWSLLKVQPSKLHEIKSSWFFNACSQELENLSRSYVKRFKLFFKKLFLSKNPVKKIVTRPQSERDKTRNEILPVEEFENLQDKYLREGIVTNDDLNFDKLMITHRNTSYNERRRRHVSFMRPRAPLPRTSAVKKKNIF